MEKGLGKIDRYFSNSREEFAKNAGYVDGDYDYGADKSRDLLTGHYSDKGKMPYHPTFSNESKYSTKETPGGEWSKTEKGWVFTPSAYQINQEGYEDKLANYYRSEYGKGIYGVSMPAPYRQFDRISDIEKEFSIKEKDKLNEK